MIVKTLDEIVQKFRNSDRNVEKKQFATRRFLLKEDGMGFAMTETIVYEGAEIELWYKNHLEAVYCIEGEAELEAVEPEPGIYEIKPGTLYALNKNDKHILRCKKKLRLVCVFYPAITGSERHDADGSYPTMDENI